MRIALATLMALALQAPAAEKATRISGVVLAREGRAPVAGAAILVNEKAVAVTDTAGRFSFEADAEEWPESIVVQAAPFTRNTVRVPTARADAQLGEILLSLGGTIDVQFAHGEVTEVEILRVVKGRVRGQSVVRKPASDAPLQFEDLLPGAYIVLAKGERPWQRFGEVVEVAAGNVTTVRQAIAPFPMAVRARFDGEPLARAEVLLTHKDGHWEDKLELDEAGEASAELWQDGRVTAAVHSTALSAPWLERRSLRSESDAEWLLDVPAREISGTVVDSRSGAPIAGAALRLKVTSDDGTTLTVGAKSDSEGHFSLTPVAYGQHVLKAAAANHPPVELSYSFREPESRRAITVRLDPAAKVRVRVTDARGNPVANARAMHFRFLARLGIAHTDDAGVIDIPVPDDAPSDLYVVPRDGSFGFAQLRSGTEEIAVRILEPASRVVLRTQSDKRAPIADVSVVVRYNGRVLPPDVVDALRAMQGARTISDHRGEIVFDRMPAGVYEFWPAGTAGELRALAFGVGPEAPVRITAAPGENVAVLTFTAAP
jgi:hypothetical protein